MATHPEDKDPYKIVVDNDQLEQPLPTSEKQIAEQLPVNSLDDSNREINLMDMSLRDYWPSLESPMDLKFLDALQMRCQQDQRQVMTTSSILHPQETSALPDQALMMMQDPLSQEDFDL